MRSHVKSSFALALFGFALFNMALAAAYPNKTVTIIVPYPPGGSADLIGRLIANKMSESMNQTVIVENKGGASGSIGSELAARARPDGYTLLVGISDTHAINPAINPKLNYKPIEDFTPVSLLAVQPFLLTVGPSMKTQTFAEFADEAKKNPGAITYASNGVGGLQHLSMELLASQSGIDVTHVPYKGSGPALADVIGGHVDSIFISLQAGKGNIDAGQLRPLAGTSGERIAALPEVPTFKESGYPDFVVQQFYALFAPAGMDPELIKIINKHAVDAILSPDVAEEKLGSAGTRAVGSTPGELKDYLQEQVDLWAKVAKENNIQLN